MEILYRPASAADVPLIMDSWLNSWRKSPWAGVIPNHLYYRLTREVIEHLIMRGAKLEVACAASNPDRILGWICTEQSKEKEPLAIVHILYVKDAFIKYGIGRALVSRAEGRKPGLYSFRTRQTEAACREAGFRHAPEVARRK